MVFAISVPAALADSYSITVTNSSTTVSIDGKTFTAYKLFDVTYTGSGASDAHAYYMSTSSPFYDATLVTGTPTSGSNAALLKQYFDFTALPGDPSKILVTPKTGYDAAAAYTLGQDLSLTGIDNSDYVFSQAASGTSATINVATAGYYIVTGEGTADTKTVTAAVALTTADPTASIAAKLDAPDIDKRIDEGDTAGTYEADKDPRYDNHAVGDTVPYILHSKVPNMTGYEKYFYIVSDTLSEGLTLNDDNDAGFVVKIGSTPLTRDTSEEHNTAGTGYYVTKDTATNSFKIVFKNFIQYKGTLQTDGTYSGDQTGEDITITYSATVNEKAVIGVEGNPNTVKLIYSNNPNEDYNHTNTTDEPTNNDVTGETPEKVVRTYVVGIKVVKVDPQGNRLSGATFELSGTDLNKVEVVTQDKFVVANDGTFYLLKDGSYTTTAPSELDVTADDYTATLAKYVNPDGDVKYKKTTVTYTEKVASESPLKVSETTNANGIIIFDGLEAGTYTLTETAAPTGYNVLKDAIEFEVEWAAPSGKTDGTGNCTWSIKAGSVTTGYNVTFDSVANEFRICIENQTGVELPSTGGVGTTIFYVAGSILVLAAAILLITKRRMGAQD